MKQYFSFVILFFVLLSQFQIGVLYAAEKQDIREEKNNSIAELDTTAWAIESATTKLKASIEDSEITKQLETKEEEIVEYLEEVQEEIQSKSSVKDIEEKVKEAKKVVVLKVVSGITEYKDLEDNISDEIAPTQQEKIEAKEVLRNSLVNGIGNYTLIVRTNNNFKKLKKSLERFDTDIDIEFLYKVWKQKYYELIFSRDSLIRQELVGDVEEWTLPKEFLDIEVIQPEILSVDKVQSEKQVKKKLLKGEDFTQIWGIEEYKTYRYFSETRKASNKIKIAVIDTGVDYTHPDLEKRVNTRLDRDFVNKDKDAMDDQGHGTHVAGTIAAAVNQSGIVWVNGFAKLVPLKICNASGFCPSYAVIKSLNYSKKKKIDIVNMSLGWRGDPNMNPICGAIADYVDAGWIVVAASGNSNVDTSTFIPGGCEQSITVGAYDRDRNKASFSNYGTKVDITAPGVDIYSTSLGGSYKKLSWTSMAAPHISGLISLMQAYDADISSDEIKTIFRSDALWAADAKLDFRKLVTLTKNPQFVTKNTDVSEEGTIEEEKTENEVVKELKNEEKDENIDFIEQQVWSVNDTVFQKNGQIENIEENEYMNELDFRESVQYFSDIEIAENISQEYEILPEVLWGDSEFINLNNELLSPWIEINTLDEDYKTVENIDISEIIFPNTTSEDSETVVTELSNIWTKDQDGIELQNYSYTWEYLDITPTILSEVPYNIEDKNISLDTGSWVQINSFDDEFIQVPEEIIWEIQRDENWEIIIDSSQEDLWESLEVTEYVEDEIIEEIEIQSVWSWEILQIEMQEETEISDTQILDIDIIWGNIPDNEIEINSLDEFGEDIIETEEEAYGTWIIIGWDYSEVEIPEWFEQINQILETEDYESGIGIQANMSQNVSIGETEFVYFDAANTYDYTFSDTSVISSFARWDAIAIIAKKPWPVVVYAKKWWVIKHRIYVIVTPKIINSEIYEWQEVSLSNRYLPTSPSYTHSKFWIVSTRNCGSNTCVKWLKAWTVKVSVKDSSGVVWYEYNVEVKAKQIHTVSLDEWKKWEINFQDANRYSYSYSAGGIVNVTRDASKLYIHTYRPWNVTVYIKQWSLVIWELRITVLKTPETFYTCNTQVEKYCTLSIPNLSWYSFSYQGWGNQYLWAYKSWDSLIVNGVKKWSTKLYLKKNNELYSTVNISVWAGDTYPSFTCKVKQGHTCKFPFSYSWPHRIHDSKGYSANYLRNGNIEIIWNKAWTNTLYLKTYDSQPWKVQTLAKINVEILPQPATKTVTCTIYEGNSCLYDLTHESDYQYSTTTQWIVNVTRSNAQFRVRGVKTWNTTFYIKSWNYIIYKVVTRVNPKPTTKQVNCDVYTSHSCKFSLSNASKYQYMFSHWWKWSISKSSSAFRFIATSSGKTTLLVKDENVVLYLVNIDITALPEVERHTIDILQTKDWGLEINPNYSYDFSIFWDGALSTSLWNKNPQTWQYSYLKIQAIRKWKVTLYIRDKTHNFLRYEITLNITEIVKDKVAYCNIDQYDTCEIDFPWLLDYNYRPEFERQANVRYMDKDNNEDLDKIYAATYNINATFEKQKDLLVITWFKPWKDTLKVTLWKTQSYSIHTTVTENPAKFPKVKKVVCDILEWDNCDFILHDARYYSYSNPVWETRVGTKSFTMMWERPWVHTAYVLQWRAPIYEIEMRVAERDSKPPLFDIESISGQCNITVGDNCLIRVDGANKYEYRSLFSGHSQVAVRNSDILITALRPGINNITWYHYGIPVFRISVSATYQDPDIELSTYVLDGLKIWSTKRITVNAKEFINVESSKAAVASVKYISETAVDVTAHSLWFAEITVSDNYNKKRVVYVQTIEEPLDISTESLTIFEWQSWYLTIEDSWTYDFSLETGNHISVFTTSTTNKYRIYGKSVWEERIYVSWNGKGAFVNIRVITHPKNAKTFSNNLVKNGTFEWIWTWTPWKWWWIAGEDKGWTQWSKNKAYSEIKDGRLFINNPWGASYVEVRNTNKWYYGIADNSIKIKPNTWYKIEYDYETKYISWTQKYWFKLGLLLSKPDWSKSESIQTLPYINTTQSLKHVKHEFKTSSTSEFLNISPVIYWHWWDKNLNMQVWVDNISLVEIVEKKPITISERVRYVRDWTNIANNSTSNVWTEIKAIERNSWINRAKGVIPTTDIQSPTWNLARLTDESLSTWWTGKSWGNKLSYMQLDLWALYDIEKVQVWHYQDGRVFKETKTEVSTDGRTWHSLHDSKINGTYNEPKDGSGRTYDVSVRLGDVWEDRPLSVEEFAKQVELLLNDVETTSNDIWIASIEDWINISSGNYCNWLTKISTAWKTQIRNKLQQLSIEKREVVLSRATILTLQNKQYEFSWACILLWDSLYLGSFIYSIVKEVSDYTRELYKQDIFTKVNELENDVNSISLEFEKWLAEWSVAWIKDYITEMIDLLTWQELLALYNALKDIDIDELKQKGSEILEEIPELITIARNIEEILDNVVGLSERKKWYYTGYLSAIVGIEMVPQLKVIRWIKKIKWTPDNPDIQDIKRFGNNWCDYKTSTLASVDWTYVASGYSCKRTNLYNNIVFESKILWQLSKRWWTESDVKNTVRSPNKVVITRDTRYKTDWTKRDDPATWFIRGDGHYVVINDIDNTVVQISDRNKVDWQSPFN